MLYLKSFLIGATSSIVTVILSTTVTTVIMTRYPQLAMRIFPAQNVDIVIGGFYYHNFPFWQILATGGVAFIIGFAWMFKRAAART